MTPEEKREYARKYYEANKEKVAERHRKYREANKEKVAAYQRRWYLKKIWGE